MNLVSCDLVVRALTNVRHLDIHTHQKTITKCQSRKVEIATFKLVILAKNK